MYEDKEKFKTLKKQYCDLDESNQNQNFFKIYSTKNCKTKFKCNFK